MAPSPLADMSPASAARALAIIAHEARVKRAADGGVVDTLKNMASTGTKAVGDAASQAMASGGDAVAKIRDWFAAHPELKAPLIGAGAGALLAGGNAAIRKKRNPLGAALLGGITGAGLGGAYSALSGAGGDAQTEKIEQVGAANEQARLDAMSSTDRLKARAQSANGLLGPVPEGSSAAGDAVGAALENPGATVGGALGLGAGLRRGADKTLLSNIRANTATPGDVQKLYPDVPYQRAPGAAPGAPGMPTGHVPMTPASDVPTPYLTTDTKPGMPPEATKSPMGPDPRVGPAVRLSRDLADPSYMRAGFPGNQVGRQATQARRLMRENDMHVIGQTPAGGPARGAANFGGQVLRGVGGAAAGGAIGYGVERFIRALPDSINMAPGSAHQGY